MYRDLSFRTGVRARWQEPRALPRAPGAGARERDQHPRPASDRARRRPVEPAEPLQRGAASLGPLHLLEYRGDAVGAARLWRRERRARRGLAVERYASGPGRLRYFVLIASSAWKVSAPTRPAGV